jgi:methylmalonyl-CoA mutase, C-terminal domain
LLNESGVSEILVIVGGIIPKEDHKYLFDAGVSQIFTPGSDTQTIVDYINLNALIKSTQGKS